MPRRTADGFDFNRANLLFAVLEKRGGLNIGMCDGYINVIGGLQLNEPAADLSIGAGRGVELPRQADGLRRDGHRRGRA